MALTIYSGILVPGGFGNRGTKGKIAAAKFARENKIPYLGICLGLQVAVIEYARNVLQLEGEFEFRVLLHIADWIRCSLIRIRANLATPCGHLHARNVQNASWRHYATGSPANLICRKT